MDQLTDAQLVERLRLQTEHGTTAAATALGVLPSSFRASILTAKARGLTASSVIPDELAKARAKLKIAERELEKIERDNLTCASLRKQVFGLAEVPPDPPAWLNTVAKHAKGTTFSVPLAFWSDWHWGEVVKGPEVGGVNEFNRAIARARLRRLVDTTCDLALRHMGNIRYPGIVVALGGDMISGNIHEELRETNDGTVQQTLIELQDEIGAALLRMADLFGKVFVPCVVGNHGRATMKPRAKHRAFENYEWTLYQQLERFFKKDKRFQFYIPDGPDAAFSVLGHRFLLTHGDALGVKGGDGLIGALGPITRGAIKIGRAQGQIGRDFDTLLMGHWHMYTPRGEGCAAVVNGTLKGFDEYAHTMLRVPYSRPSQAFMCIHAEHGITAQWQVFLEPHKRASADADWVRFPQEA